MREMLYVFFAFISSCNLDSRVPEKPAAVPETAVWAGGVDGGSWIDCGHLAEVDLHYCRIYYDYSGEIWIEGIFRSPPGVDLPLDFRHFNGTVIELKDGNLLQPEFDPWSAPAGRSQG